MLRFKDKTAIAFLAMLVFSVAQAADFSGVPRVVDGDTLVIGTTKFRMEGIDAPETDQVCLNARGARWTCGIDARDQLAAHVAGGLSLASPMAPTVIGEPSPRARWGRRT